MIIFCEQRIVKPCDRDVAWYFFAKFTQRADDLHRNLIVVADHRIPFMSRLSLHIICFKNTVNIFMSEFAVSLSAPVTFPPELLCLEWWFWSRI